MWEGTSCHQQMCAFQLQVSRNTGLAAGYVQPSSYSCIKTHHINTSHTCTCPGTCTRGYQPIAASHDSLDADWPQPPSSLAWLRGYVPPSLGPCATWAPLPREKRSVLRSPPPPKKPHQAHVVFVAESSSGIPATHRTCWATPDGHNGHNPAVAAPHERLRASAPGLACGAFPRALLPPLPQHTIPTVSGISTCLPV